jgi:hypothetical protein
LDNPAIQVAAKTIGRAPWSGPPPASLCIWLRDLMKRRLNDLQTGESRPVHAHLDFRSPSCTSNRSPGAVQTFKSLDRIPDSEAQTPRPLGRGTPDFRACIRVAHRRRHQYDGRRPAVAAPARGLARCYVPNQVALSAAVVATLTLRMIEIPSLLNFATASCAVSWDPAPV